MASYTSNVHGPKPFDFIWFNKRTWPLAMNKPNIDVRPPLGCCQPQIPALVWGAPAARTGTAAPQTPPKIDMKYRPKANYKTQQNTTRLAEAGRTTHTKHMKLKSVANP